MVKKIIFSGIQPTGNLHIGNYLGAVKNWVELQNNGEYQCYFCIVDYHSLTGDMKAGERHDQIIRTAAELLAAGVDPEKSVFYVQSHVPEHTELAWVFNTVTPISELERMTQFKDKSERQTKNINAGLFTYPVLQAADILLYHANIVPVGVDQFQHVELTRDIARWFNKRYGDYFPEAKALLTEIPKVMSLLEPTKKMSKSLGAGHVIELADELTVIEKKLKKAVTASEGGAKAPGVENLLLLLKQFGEEKVYKQFVQAEKDCSIRYGDLKNEVSNAVGNYFVGFRTRRAELLIDHNQIADILARGAKRACEVARSTMEDVRRLVGIR
ncbi:MAG: tryptophan--tRNA ligase [Candidatus Magasanikbacteria bacterium CG_4_10_14_0_2_um_filter_37_12]|uniref:Tryptophan--tRNA ligase n=1 Tax=Candidatus Magasanikbacteria bacterium CG_4_10_14_0_2_um_filter_37_12 TaxID=1974637 RepID=A0A2M7V6X2_9BACT|nr:MAG: tryptophan--tRNA ligase [Candidatus Magasanikbacteria bacterium CG_4_10_14_0_2_um_filter_37_12]